MILERQMMLARQRIADRRGRGVYAGWPDEQRAIFIHVPKTAGSSLAQRLHDGPSRHVPCTAYLDANARKFASYWKFAFVRNPWDRLASSFAFLRRGGMNAQDAAFASTHLARFPDFGAFVREGLGRPEICNWVHFRPQCHFICARGGRNRMDFTGRFERIADDYRLVAERLGLEGDLPVTNRTPRPDYRDQYDDETAEIVETFYRADIDLLGYRYEPAE